MAKVIAGPDMFSLVSPLVAAVPVRSTGNAPGQQTAGETGINLRPVNPKILYLSTCQMDYAKAIARIK